MISTSSLRFAPDYSLTIPITSSTIIEPASLRSDLPDRNRRNSDRFQAGTLIAFAGIRIQRSNPVTGASWEALGKQKTDTFRLVVPGDTAMAFSSVTAGRQRIKTLLSFGCQGGSQTRWVRRRHIPNSA
jgi:hypothetical protein